MTSFTRMLCFLLAIYIFNFSVDSRDRSPDQVSEDLTFNDIESILELVFEVALGFENAFSESDEPDPDDRGAFDFTKIFFSSTIQTIDLKEYSSECEDALLHRLYNFFASQFLEIDSPPPRG